MQIWKVYVRLNSCSTFSLISLGLFSLFFYIPFLIYLSSATTGLHSSHRATAPHTSLSHEIPQYHDVSGEDGMIQILAKIDQIAAELQALKVELNEM